MTSTTGRNDKQPRAGGFTLLELILVLVLISVLLAVSAPTLRGMFASRQEQDAAARILALTQWARSQAAADGTVYRLNVDAPSSTHWLTAQQAGVFAELHSDLGRHFRLADGLTLGLTTNTGQNMDYVQFYPDGRHDAGIVRIVGRRGETYSIASLSITEGFRIAHPAQEPMR
jgi:prepilin-type N-terminal cleavage/methylation domain-containing protein